MFPYFHLEQIFNFSLQLKIYFYAVCYRDRYVRECGGARLCDWTSTLRLKEKSKIFNRKYFENDGKLEETKYYKAVTDQHRSKLSFPLVQRSKFV